MTPTALRALLVRLGLSQRRAARALGVAQSAVNQWCTGRYPIPVPIALLLQLWARHGVPDGPACDQDTVQDR